ncbi:MAG: hypothetical protein JOZ87_28230 [Chloroflexi bacterium]|nr:hypothetical protein [Chloroflexota bacterium]
MPGVRISPTVNGHDALEVVSALQKTIRRGEIDNALHWAMELEDSGFGLWCWKRLRIICSEDVGPAWPEGPAVIEALYRTYLDMRKLKDGKPTGPHRLFTLHAVYLLASAPKSRVVDWAGWVRLPPEFRPIPDVAKDQHTLAGKRKGRGLKHFFEEGTQLHPHVPQPLEDEYRSEARRMLDPEQQLGLELEGAADDGSPDAAGGE